MHEDPTTPPPPGSLPPPAGPATGKATDNPIAVAGLVVSLLALVLSIIAIGGIIAFAGFSLSVIGLRRSKYLGRGRGAAIGGIALAVIAFLFSIGATLIIVNMIRSADDTVVDGVASSSDNTAFPPQDDLDSVECSTSEGGDLPLAIVTITNRSGGESVYQITVEWETAGSGVASNRVKSEFVADGDSETFRLFDLSGAGVVDSCRVVRIERSGLGLFTG